MRSRSRAARVCRVPSGYWGKKVKEEDEDKDIIYRAKRKVLFISKSKVDLIKDSISVLYNSNLIFPREIPFDHEKSDELNNLRKIDLLT